MIAIDGDQGEGGGQVLRTSLALSAHTGQPFHVTSIRSRRSRPGLLRQHLTAVQAAVAVCDAEVTGAELGSQELFFRSRAVKPGAYTFAVGTAGSATLVCQTVLPPLLLARASSSLTLRGGTHNGHSPPWHFLAKTFLPVVASMGPELETTLRRWGFYPAGGGDFTVEIAPAPLRPLALLERGAFRGVAAVAAVSSLPRSIAERELAVIGRRLGLERRHMTVLDVDASPGPGNVAWIESTCERVTDVSTGFGAKAVTADSVADSACAEHETWRDAGVPVGEHLADQLLIPVALAGSGVFRTTRPSLHT